MLIRGPGLEKSKGGTAIGDVDGWLLNHLSLLLIDLDFWARAKRFVSFPGGTNPVYRGGCEKQAWVLSPNFLTLVLIAFELSVSLMGPWACGV